MISTHKEQVKIKLRAEYDSLQSMAKLENLTGVSKSYLSQILNDKADPAITTWNKLFNYYGISKPEYQIVETENYKAIHTICRLSQSLKTFNCVIGNAGSGKSTALREYARQNENAFYVECRDFNQKRFMYEIQKALNIESFGSVSDMIDAIRNKLRTLTNPIIILDEASQLKEGNLLRIKELYGDMGNAVGGVVMFGVEYLEKHLADYSRKNKRGYKELTDRIQKPIARLRPANENEVRYICEANGVTDNSLIDIAVREAKVSGSFRAARVAIINQKSFQMYNQVNG